RRAAVMDRGAAQRRLARARKITVEIDRHILRKVRNDPALAVFDVNEGRAVHCSILAHRIRQLLRRSVPHAARDDLVDAERDRVGAQLDLPIHHAREKSVDNGAGAHREQQADRAKAQREPADHAVGSFCRFFAGLRAPIRGGWLVLNPSGQDRRRQRIARRRRRNFDRSRAVDRNVLEAMNRRIMHRGPDDDGFYVAENIGLAMRRLSIIDLATGHQPMCNEDGTVWIVFNGEIYNHQELRPHLEARGHRYRSRSDTETILHLYEEYGRNCVQHLRGMFAFAIWDARSRRLFCARDRLGIKPFYYHLSPERFLFGSEIKALLAHPALKAEFNRSVLPEYLAFGYIANEETFFRGIRKLMPGHTLELNETGQTYLERYWDLSAPPEEDHKPRKYYVESYRQMLEEAVSSHLMSDVPLGVFLSGGLDSSVVAALTTRLRHSPIETFSVGYAEAAYSELPFAQTVADYLGSVHHEVRISWADFMEALPRLIW